ncbi:MAG: hypothetical protein ACRD2X_06810 [Vicinamibacteraceae bacterium]
MSGSNVRPIVAIGGGIRGVQVVDRYARREAGVFARIPLASNANVRVGAVLIAILLALLGILQRVQTRDASASVDRPLVTGYVGSATPAPEQQQYRER